MKAVDMYGGSVNMQIVWRWMYDRRVDLESYQIAEVELQ